MFVLWARNKTTSGLQISASGNSRARKKRSRERKKVALAKKSSTSNKKSHQQKKVAPAEKKFTPAKKSCQQKKNRATGKKVCAKIWCCRHTCMALTVLRIFVRDHKMWSALWSTTDIFFYWELILWDLSKVQKGRWTFREPKTVKWLMKCTKWRKKKQ